MPDEASSDWTVAPPTAEATEALTYKQCYALVLAVSKAACLQLQESSPDCPEMADALAKVACESLQGSSD